MQRYNIYIKDHLFLLCPCYSIDKQPYRMVYFNEMNLAIKSPLMSKNSTYLSVTPDMMCLLTQLNAEYDK